MEIPRQMLSASVVLNRKHEKQSHQYNRSYLKNPKNCVPSASCSAHGHILRPRALSCPAVSALIRHIPSNHVFVWEHWIFSLDGKRHSSLNYNSCTQCCTQNRIISAEFGHAVTASPST